MSSAPEDRQKWALLIGINEYPKFAPRGQLTGCINDVEVMRQVLTNSFNFSEDHVEVLTDSQASQEGIRAAMRALVQRVGADDIVVVHYSGHGSQMTDIEGDEPDGRDETIVPWDSGRAPHENRDIKDDEIYLWLKDLTAKTTNVTLIFDCCHSGTVVRDPFGGEARWVPPDLRPPSELPPSPIPMAARGLLDGGRDIGPSGWLPMGERYVLFSGCSRDERSFEVEESGTRHGALTFFLSQELLKTGSGTTYRDVFEAVAPRVSSRFPDQHPQLEGARDLEVFGVQRIEPMTFVPVIQRSGDRVVLGGGAACGLTEGSQWAIHPAGTKAVAPEAEPLGVVALTAVRAVTSEARLLREVLPDSVQAGMRAVEESHALDTRMAVEVVTRSGGADVEALSDGIGRSRLLVQTAPGEHAKARIYLLAPRTRVDEEDPVPQLGPLGEETWAVVGEDGQLLMPARRRGEPQVVRRLVENLEKTVRYRTALDLKNDLSPIAGKVQVDLFRKTAMGLQPAETGPGGLPVFREGDYVALKIFNGHDRPLFLYVLDFGLTGRVQLVYPPLGAEDCLLPGVNLELGTQPGREIEVYIPDEFPFLATGPGEDVEGLETIKVLFTTHPADLQPLLQTSFREGRGGPAQSLSDLLATSLSGGGYCAPKDARMRSQLDGPEDWTALERSFRVRRPASHRAVAGGRGI
jgi:hypothetical protein